MADPWFVLNILGICAAAWYLGVFVEQCIHALVHSPYSPRFFAKVHSNHHKLYPPHRFVQPPPYQGGGGYWLILLAVPFMPILLTYSTSK